MSSIPLPALDIRPPQQPDPIASLQRVLAIKAILGQQKTQQLQQTGLEQENEQRALTLGQTQAVNQAYRDALTVDQNTGTPSIDTDKLSKSLAAAGHGAAIPGILKTTADYQKSMADAAKAQSDVATSTQDALGAAGAAIKAANYDPNLADVILQHHLSMPNLPPAYKQQLQSLDQQIQQNPNMVKQIADQLIAGSSKQRELGAQETAASARAQASATGAARLAGELDPTSPLYEPTDDYLNARAAAGDQQAQAILDARAKQAGNVAGAQEAAKLPFAGPKAAAEAAAKQPYEIQLAKLRQGPEPVYAYDPAQKATVLTTQGEAEAANMQGIRKVTENDITKDTQSARQLGDAQMNLSAYRMASRQMGDLSATDQSRIASIMADPKLRVGIFGTQLPTNWLSTLSDSSYWKQLSPAAQDAMVGYIGARGSVIAYTKSISGTGRLTQQQLETELKNIPNPTVPSNVREAQFDRFQRNIDQAGSGLPVLPGVDRPADIRNRIENAPQQTPQPTGKYKASSGRAPNVGDLIPFRGSSLKVSQVFPDGSFNAQ